MLTVLFAVLVTAGLFIALAAALLAAERRLVHYGTCCISINNGKHELAVEGGGNLLSAMLESNIAIPASCGGRGMCGFCKVRVTEGGGELLPTETPFLSRQAIAAGTRLACQVKVRQDIKASVPDFLEVVMEMVRSGTFDRHSKWRFRIQGEEHEGF